MTIFEKVQDIIAGLMGSDQAITPETSFYELDMDCLDVIEMVLEIEHEFDIEISDDDYHPWLKVKDVVAYLEKRRVVC